MSKAVDEPYLSELLRGRRILVTGHTGFKGGWLSLWLRRLGRRRRIGVHGGSMRVLLQNSTGALPPTPIVEQMLAEERDDGIQEIETYGQFAARIEEIGMELNAMLKQLKADGAKSAGSGALARGSTLLN